MKLLILFDIDGTILYPGTLARQLMDEEVTRFTGKSPQLQVEDVAGFTDPIIIHNALQKIKFTDGGLTKAVDIILQNYFNRLQEEYPRYPKPYLYEDAMKLVHRCKLEGWQVGLLSGNMRKAAKVKLSRFKIWDEFAFGVFGDEASTREDLLWLAQEQAWDELGKVYTYSKMVMVGDTPNDARVAAMNGVRSLIVCRSPEWREEIEAMKPTWLVDSFEDLDSIIIKIKE